MILHITTRQEWSRVSTEYAPPSLEAEGFIHCSTASQVEATAGRFFAGRPDLLLLVLDEIRIAPQLRWEAATDVADDFPHLYRPITPADIVEIVDFPCQPDGTFRLPPELLVK